MKHTTLLITLALLAAQLLSAADAPKPPELKTLPPRDFLTVIRDPLRADAWSVITGRVTHARQGQDLLHGDVRLSIRLSPKKMTTQITLNEKNTYILYQSYDKLNSNTKIELDMPKNEQKPSLFDFGLQPDDLSFAFFYWDFIGEETTISDEENGYRIMKLRNPQQEGASVKVWFNSKHGFPVEAQWLDKSGKVERKLELKGAKRHKNGLWFVKEMRLEDGSQAWKTQVRFDYVEKNEIGE